MSAIRYVKGTLPGIEGEHEIAILDGDCCAGKWVEEARRIDHDQWLLPRIGEYITPESVVYDVGAYFGDHTAYYASKAAFVVAFEPMPDAFEALWFNMRNYSNRILYKLALGDGERVSLDHEGTSTEKNFGARFLAKREDGAATTKLDDIGTSVLRPPSLLKLDVEGWEVNVFRGAEQTIKRYCPIVVCEVNRGALERAGTSPSELHALLTGMGYEARDIITGEIWRPEDKREQFDIVAEVDKKRGKITLETKR